MSTLKIKRENGKIFCPLADSWHIETPEEKVRQEYIKILVENYGYSLDQMAQEIKVNNSQRGQGKARADIVIWKSKQDILKSDNTEKSQTKTDPTTTDMNLHYNIQIHLPETTNMAVYDAIFQSLKKHLMSQTACSVVK